MKIAIIGGGAAGFFAAINILEQCPTADVTIYEASSQPLAKVGVSGGGRCNLTNTFAQIGDLSEAYPRGAKLMRGLFKTFDNQSTVEWFESRGVELVTQPDECLFPKSQSSQEIIDTFGRLLAKLGGGLKSSHRVSAISPLSDGGYRVSFVDAKLADIYVDTVVVTTGGSPKIEGLSMLDGLDLQFELPVPSLFTFNTPHREIRELMGAVVDPAMLSIQGTKFLATGALLLTHWGLSGPAALKLSSYAARYLDEKEYKAIVVINWVCQRDNDRVHSELLRLLSENQGRLITNIRPFGLPSRVWEMLLRRAEIPHERRCVEVGSKGVNRLVNRLTNDQYEMDGQSRFREEFVTCGGVSLKSINPATMEARKHPNLYFAGEVVDVDAITGGFNLQAAWSMGFVVVQSIIAKLGGAES
ncbi:MAG: aminoacetone oxidase family FAD-binding enzyme [Rikenellaceae bacterium]